MLFKQGKYSHIKTENYFAFNNILAGGHVFDLTQSISFAFEENMGAVNR